MASDEVFLSALTIRCITRDLDSKSFACKEEIDWFLQKVACEHHEQRITNVLCWLDGAAVAGYITTSMTTVNIDIPAQRQGLGLDAVKFTEQGAHQKRFPALLIGMLGVSNQYTRRGLAEQMVKTAIGQALSLSDTVGCRFVTVDSDPSEAALGLYTKVGFLRIAQKKEERATVWMYYDLGRRQ